MIGGFSLATVFTVLFPALLPVTAAAVQDQQFREREVLEPEAETWSPAGPAAEGTVLSEARRLLAEGDPREAEDLLAEWLENNPDDERRAEARFLLAEAWFERGDYWRAYENYEIVVEESAGELFFRALRREVDVARAFLAGEPRIVWRILRFPAQDDGIEILDRVWERVPGTRLGETALKIKADYFFQNGDMQIAQDEYAHLYREYPSGRYAQLALLRSAEAADAAYAGVKYDDSTLVEAEERYRQFMEAYPALADREQVPQRLESIRIRRAEKDLYIAKWYERVERPDAAEFYYRAIIRDWPGTIAASEARTRLLGLGVDLEAEAATGERATHESTTREMGGAGE